MTRVLPVADVDAAPLAVAALAVAAVLLSLERLFYLWAWNQPQQFTRWWNRTRMGAPLDVMERACTFFKLLQAAVFILWCTLPGHELMYSELGRMVARLAGITMMLVGQFLNYSVFRRLGRVGVFYGNRFGHRVQWCTEFPFSVLTHPQYVGALLSIWGFFLLVRFPHADWFFLPALETLYYGAGAYLER